MKTGWRGRPTPAPGCGSDPTVTTPARTAAVRVATTPATSAPCARLRGPGRRRPHWRGTPRRRRLRPWRLRWPGFNHTVRRQPPACKLPQRRGRGRQALRSHREQQQLRELPQHAAWLPVTVVDHTQVQGSCASCHNGALARGKPKSHIASSNACEAATPPMPGRRRDLTTSRWRHIPAEPATTACTPWACLKSYSHGRAVRYLPRHARLETCEGRPHDVDQPLRQLPQQQHRVGRAPDPHDQQARLRHLPQLSGLDPNAFHAHFGLVSGSTIGGLWSALPVIPVTRTRCRGRRQRMRGAARVVTRRISRPQRTRKLKPDFRTRQANFVIAPVRATCTATRLSRPSPSRSPGRITGLRTPLSSINTRLCCAGATGDGAGFRCAMPLRRPRDDVIWRQDVNRRHVEPRRHTDLYGARHKSLCDLVLRVLTGGMGASPITSSSQGRLCIMRLEAFGSAAGIELIEGVTADLSKPCLAVTPARARSAHVYGAWVAD